MVIHIIKYLLLFILFLSQFAYAETKEANLIKKNKIGSLDSTIAVTTNMQGIAFSTDNMHVAYIVGTRGSRHVYHDGKNGFDFEEIKEDSLIFSPDGKHLVYIANQFGKWMTVLDGTPQGQYEDIKSNSLKFSPDSKRLAYIAKGFSGWGVVVDGKPGKTSYTFIKEDSISFSPDSLHIAYITGLYNRYFILLDHKEVGEYNMFAPNAGIVWDSFNIFHYLIIDNNRDILVVTYKF